jgi:thiamine-monophosphate kinase
MEHELVDWLKKHLPSHPALKLGIGDDAAVLSLLDSSQCVVTVDLLMEGVDFELAEIDARRAGHKALAVNLSDLAAMAAVPVAVVVGLALPRKNALELAVRLYEGMLPLAEQFNVAIAGGDTNTWDGPLAISVTALGTPTQRGVWRRDGASPGDEILVTGSFGGSLLGRHLNVEPRIREALILAERYDIHAAIDVSDGLSLDLARLADASGCGAVVDLDQVPIADAAGELARVGNDGRTPLDHALADGEDFELVLAAAPAVAARILADRPLHIPITRIGQFTTKRGLWQASRDGSHISLPARGYVHHSDQ